MIVIEIGSEEIRTPRVRVTEEPFADVATLDYLPQAGGTIETRFIQPGESVTIANEKEA